MMILHVRWILLLAIAVSCQPDENERDPSVRYVDYGPQEDSADEMNGIELTVDDDKDEFVRQNRAYNGDNPNKQSTSLEYPVFPEDDRSSEPSCEELRAIWRMTKRAARHSILTNEIPRHEPTSLYGYMVHSSLPDLPGQNGGRDLALPPGQAFGRILLEPHGKFSSHHRKPYRAPHHGSYDRVEEMLRRGIFADKPYKQLGATGKFRNRGSVLYSAPYYVTPRDAINKSSKYNGQSVPKPFAYRQQPNSYGSSSTAAKYHAYPSYRTSVAPPNSPSVVYGVYNDPDINYAAASINSEQKFNLMSPQPSLDLLKSRSNSKMAAASASVRNDKMSVLRRHLQNEKLLSDNAGFVSDSAVDDANDDDDDDNNNNDGKYNGQRNVEGSAVATALDSSGFSADSSGCQTLKSKKCRTNDDCSCYGLYGCVSGKCKTYTSKTKALRYGKPVTEAKGSRGFWHEGTLPESTLRDHTTFGPQKYRSEFTDRKSTGPIDRSNSGPKTDSIRRFRVPEDQEELILSHRRKP